MNVFDENIPEDQRQLLRSWRIRVYQIGRDIGRQGLKDEQQIIPLLLKLRRPTFFTRDLGFFGPEFCHAKYCLACLAIEADEAASFVRRLLRHSAFDTMAKRMGRVLQVSQMGIRVLQLRGAQEAVHWEE